MITPSRPTQAAVFVSLVMMAGSGVFLASQYPVLSDILPVHFMANGYPNGWQFKTYARVLMPLLVQLALAVTFGAVAALLLSRPHGQHDREAADVRAAKTAAEAVTLIALIWIAFQAYAAIALVTMWHRQRAGLGALYYGLEVTGVVASVLVFARANLQFGRPEPRPFVAAHWRFGHLYKNPDDPALFVPTRDGSRWTLNFGRPVAAALLGIVLLVGVVGPAAILGFLLR